MSDRAIRDRRVVDEQEQLRLAEQIKINSRRNKSLAEALEQTRLAYPFGPDSYTYGAIWAVIAAADAHPATPDWIEEILDWNVGDQPVQWLAADTEDHLDEADWGGPLHRICRARRSHGREERCMRPSAYPDR
jgi:hypothetical protein